MGAAGGKESMAALMVPEHGSGKSNYLGGGDYELVSEGEDDEPQRPRQPPAGASGTYALAPPPGHAGDAGAPAVAQDLRERTLPFRR